MTRSAWPRVEHPTVGRSLTSRLGRGARHPAERTAVDEGGVKVDAHRVREGDEDRPAGLHPNGRRALGDRGCNPPEQLLRLRRWRGAEHDLVGTQGIPGFIENCPAVPILFDRRHLNAEPSVEAFCQTSADRVHAWRADDPLGLAARLVDAIGANGDDAGVPGSDDAVRGPPLHAQGELRRTNGEVLRAVVEVVADSEVGHTPGRHAAPRTARLVEDRHRMPALGELGRAGQPTDARSDDGDSW